MWKHCSPVFHFNWLYFVPRPLYNNPLLKYRYQNKTYWTFALHWLTFSTTVNTTNSCMEQPWCRLFLLLSQKLWCNMQRNAPLQLTHKQYHSGYAMLMTPFQPFTKTNAFHNHLNEQNTDIQFTKEIEENRTSFSRLFGKPWQQRTVNDSVQKTDAYGQITWRNHPTTQLHTKPLLQRLWWDEHN